MLPPASTRGRHEVIDYSHPGTKHHDPQSLRKLYMNYIHAMLEYLHLKLICIPSSEHDIQCTTFATNHIREGEIPNLLSFWVPQKEYEKF